MESGERPEGFGDLSHGQTQMVYEGIALANHYLRGPEQTVEFVAKVISRDKGCKLRPWREDYGRGILATPLYIAQTEIKIVDDDNHAEKLGEPS